MPEANVSHFPTVHLIMMGDSFKTFAVFYIFCSIDPVVKILFEVKILPSCGRLFVLQFLRSLCSCYLINERCVTSAYGGGNIYFL